MQYCCPVWPLCDWLSQLYHGWVLACSHQEGEWHQRQLWFCTQFRRNVATVTLEKMTGATDGLLKGLAEHFTPYNNCADVMTKCGENVRLPLCEAGLPTVCSVCYVSIELSVSGMSAIDRQCTVSCLRTKSWGLLFPVQTSCFSSNNIKKQFSSN